MLYLRKIKTNITKTAAELTTFNQDIVSIASA